MAGALAGSLLLALPALSAGGGSTELLAVGGSQPVDGDSSTYGTVVSASGRFVVFTADADNLPGADGTQDIYVRDRKRATTRLVSQSTSGEPANARCSDGPSISADGRLIAFQCDATNLGGGTGGIFLRDRKKHTTKLVSRTSSGEPADGGPDRPALSANGRFVAFEGDAVNLPGTPGVLNGYVRDLKKGTTELTTETNDGTPLEDANTRYSSISATGRYIVFWSISGLLPGQPGVNSVYVRDRREGKTKLVSKTPNGTPADGNSVQTEGAISADGRFIAFRSDAPNLGGTPGQPAFLKDMKTGKVVLVSRTAQGDPADGSDQSVSANGRYVVFDSSDDDLPGLAGVDDVYRFDRRTKKVILISRTSKGKPADDDSFYAATSAAANVVAFESAADNLSPADNNNHFNAFVRVP